MAATPYTSRAIKAELETEITDLRRTLDNGNRYTIERWEQFLPQPTRDALAARALIHCNGDAFRAAARLGFAPIHKRQAEDVIARLFGTEGVKAILERDLQKPEENRQALIERQVRIALYGDDSTSVKAFQMLAKCCGWVKTPDVLVQNNRQTILALVTQKNARGEEPAALDQIIPAFLEHEPGAPTRIDSGEYVAIAQSDDEV